MQQEMPVSFSDIPANTPGWFPLHPMVILGQTNTNVHWSLSKIWFRSLWYIHVHPHLLQEKGLIHPILPCSQKPSLMHPCWRFVQGMVYRASGAQSSWHVMEFSHQAELRPCGVSSLGPGVISPLRSCRHETVWLFSLQRATLAFISALDLSCSEGDGILN